MKNINKNLGILTLMGLLLGGVIIISGCIGGENGEQKYSDNEIPLGEQPNGKQKSTDRETTEEKTPITIECEYVDDYTVGDPNIWRSHASKKKVLGQFGCEGKSPWNPKSGYAKYNNISISETGDWAISIKYSCNNIHSVPIRIYLDDEPEHRAIFYPKNTHDWNIFQENDKINLGAITAGNHSITFKTDGVKYGAADLDYFVLSIQ